MPVSFFQTSHIQCDICHEKLTIHTWLIIDATERPDLWKYCKDGSIHDFACPQGHVNKIFAPLLLHDGPAGKVIFSLLFDKYSKVQIEEMITSLLGILRHNLPASKQGEYLKYIKMASPAELPAAMDYQVEEFTFPEHEGPLSNQEFNALIQELRRTFGEKDIQRCIGLCERGLQRINSGEEKWGLLQAEFAGLLSKTESGDIAENLDKAIATYKSALSVCSPDRYPGEWGGLQFKLAQVYFKRINGEADQNIAEAVTCAEAALSVFSEDRFPVDRRNVEQLLKAAGLKRSQNAQPEIIPLDGALPSNIPSVMTEIKNCIDTGNADHLVSLCQLQLLIVTLKNEHQWAYLQYYLAEGLMNSTKGAPADNFEKAIQLLEEALAKISYQSHPYSWVLLKKKLGLAYAGKPDGDQINNFENAVASLNGAFSAVNYTTDPLSWEQIHFYLGRAYSSLFSHTLSFQHLEHAIAAYEAPSKMPNFQSSYRSSQPAEWAKHQLGLADLYRKRQVEPQLSKEKAISVYRAALEIITAESDPVSWAAALINLSIVYQERSAGLLEGNLQSALECVNYALKVFNSSDHPLEWATCEYNLGRIYQETYSLRRLWDLERAIASFNKALTIFSQEAYPDYYAKCYLALIVLYRKRKEGADCENIEAAIRSAGAALGVFTFEDTPWEWAFVQQEMASAYLRREKGDPIGNIQLAVTAYKRALTVFTYENHPTNHAINMANLGNAYMMMDYCKEVHLPEQLEREDQELAIEAYETTLNLRKKEDFFDKYPRSADNMESVRNAREWVQFKWMLGRLYKNRKKGNAEENRRQAIEHYTAALELCTLDFGASLRRVIAEDLGNLYAKLSDWEKAFSYYQIAVIASKTEYSFAETETNKSKQIGETTSLYESITKVCLRLNPQRSLEAFLFVEEGRSRLLREQFGTLPLPPPRQVPAAVIEQETRLIHDLRILQQQINNTPEGQNKWDLSDQVMTVRNTLETLWNTLSEKYQAGDYVSLRRGAKIDWIDVQQWLDGQERDIAILEFFSVEERFIAFVLRKGEAEPHIIRLEITLSELRPYLARLSREVHDFNPDYPLKEYWKEVSPLLLDKVMPYLNQASLLYIVPYGMLHTLPFHALVYNDQPLTFYFPIIYVPSVAALLLITRAGKPESNRTGLEHTLLVVGNAEGDTEGRELPGAEEEAIEIAHRFGTSPLLRSQATIERVQHELAKVHHAHFATHALFNPTDPFASGIEMSDGILTARQIAAQPLQTQSIVLSACQTGIQKVEAGDELVGLARAFLYVGVSSLVLSLWKIDDAFTKAWMYSFYNHLYNAAGDKQMSAAEAVRLATLETYEKSPHTCDWAPFILYGDWT